MTIRLSANNDGSIESARYQHRPSMASAYSSFGVVTSYCNGVLQLNTSSASFGFTTHRVYANKPQSTAMRDWRDGCALAVESLIDDIAHRIGMDPVEMRMKEFLGTAHHPSPSANTASLPTPAANRSKTRRSVRDGANATGNCRTDIGWAWAVNCYHRAHCLSSATSCRKAPFPQAGFRWPRTGRLGCQRHRTGAAIRCSRSWWARSARPRHGAPLRPRRRHAHLTRASGPRQLFRPGDLHGQECRQDAAGELPRNAIAEAVSRRHGITAEELNFEHARIPT
ncbi:MAG: molybdopterin-dependent oxidoreductase [Flavobacteriales bacterium]|nr:molybdopterin-dependent oxidoreductase [Flavobacteriales bacterium]